MRHTFAISWLFPPLAAIILLASSLAADTIDTIEGEHYEGIKILKMEDDGVIVKHTRGIAKIPFYELDEATRRALGHTGEVAPPIRHRKPPESGLLGDIEGNDVNPADLDLDVEHRTIEKRETPDPPTQVKVKTPQKQPSKQIVTRRVIAKTASVANKPTVGVSAIGRGSWHNARKVAPAHKHHHHGCGCGCGDYPTITTRYTPYGNFSYYGRPNHWYGYYNPPCNRCRFEKVDHRRWQGRR